MSKFSKAFKYEKIRLQATVSARRAFTMLELVVVIVVIGILAMAALPRLEQDHIGSAVDDIMAAVRRTQLLAMQDSKVDPTTNPGSPTWHTGRWTIEIAGDRYTITNRSTGERIFGVLDRRYGITAADINCPVVYAPDPIHLIGFDEFGRILDARNAIRGYGNDAINSSFYQTPCTITVETRSRKATITVAPTTGNMTVVYQ